MSWDRRAFLALVSGALAGIGGCLGGSPPDQSSTTGSNTAPPTDAQTPSQTETPTHNGTDRPGSQTSPGRTDATRAPGATTPGTFVVRAGDPDPDPAVPLRVYPADLRETLRVATQRDGPVRTTGSAHVYVPEPVLPVVETVEILDPTGEATGTYDVDCQGGTRYELLVGAEEATPPPDATVTPAADLPDDRRSLAVAAIENEGPRVYPETELGEWVRTEFFDGYVSHAGTTYRGREVQQTDAAFFSTTVWYVLELSPTDAATGVTLDLSPVEAPVRDFFEPVLEARSKDQPSAVVDGPMPSEVVSFLEATDRILTHPTALSLAVE